MALVDRKSAIGLRCFGFFLLRCLNCSRLSIFYSFYGLFYDFCGCDLFCDPGFWFVILLPIIFERLRC